MPVVRKLAPDLWEVRLPLDQRIGRILFTVSEGRVVLLHGFIKKTQKTPQSDLDLAKRPKASLNPRHPQNDMNQHIGSTLDDFLAEEDLLAEAVAIKRVVAFQLRQRMTEQQLTKAELARRMGTSRSALDRLLDPDNASVTLLTLERAAKALGQRIRIELAA
jgi:predicted XRE-type DNA-binding protein